MREERQQKRVCLITPAHLSTNPRLTKEADALVSAGYEVHIICCRFMAWPDRADRQFLDRPWIVQKIEYGPLAKTWHRAFFSIRRRIYRSLIGVICPMQGLSERAFHWIVPELTSAALSKPADLYVAHNLAALPAAYHAARTHNAKLGFDAEDFHSGEVPDTPENAQYIALARDIESRYLRHCDYITAASPGIARVYAELYGVELPVVTLNVFPRAEAPASFSERGSASHSPSLYWFSQTIGPGRGLETVIEAIGLSRSRPMLFLRGNPIPRYVAGLRRLAEQHNVADLLQILPTGSPEEMPRLASEFDIGLATETSMNPNRDICLSNKLFTYLLAGIPVLATDTAGQTEIAANLQGAVWCYPQYSAKDLAKGIDRLLCNPETLANSRRQAWSLAQERYNWNIEQAKFLQQVTMVLRQNN